MASPSHPPLSPPGPRSTGAGIPIRVAGPAAHQRLRGGPTSSNHYSGSSSQAMSDLLVPAAPTSQSTHRSALSGHGPSRGYFNDGPLSWKPPTPPLEDESSRPPSPVLPFLYREGGGSHGATKLETGGNSSSSRYIHDTPAVALSVSSLGELLRQPKHRHGAATARGIAPTSSHQGGGDAAVARTQALPDAIHRTRLFAPLPPALLTAESAPNTHLPPGLASETKAAFSKVYASLRAATSTSASSSHVSTHSGSEGVSDETPPPLHHQQTPTAPESAGASRTRTRSSERFSPKLASKRSNSASTSPVSSRAEGTGTPRSPKQMRSQSPPRNRHGATSVDDAPLHGSALVALPNAMGSASQSNDRPQARIYLASVPGPVASAESNSNSSLNVASTETHVLLRRQDAPIDDPLEHLYRVRVPEVQLGREQVSGAWASLQSFVPSRTTGKEPQLLKSWLDVLRRCVDESDANVSACRRSLTEALNEQGDVGSSLSFEQLMNAYTTAQASRDEARGSLSQLTGSPRVSTLQTCAPTLAGEFRAHAAAFESLAGHTPEDFRCYAFQLALGVGNNSNNGGRGPTDIARLRHAIFTLYSPSSHSSGQEDAARYLMSLIPALPPGPVAAAEDALIGGNTTSMALRLSLLKSLYSLRTELGERLRTSTQLLSVLAPQVAKLKAGVELMQATATAAGLPPYRQLLSLTVAFEGGEEVRSDAVPSPAHRKRKVSRELAALAMRQAEREYRDAQSAQLQALREEHVQQLAQLRVEAEMRVRDMYHNFEKTIQDTIQHRAAEYEEQLHAQVRAVATAQTQTQHVEEAWRTKVACADALAVATSQLHACVTAVCGGARTGARTGAHEHDDGSDFNDSAAAIVHLATHQFYRQAVLASPFSPHMHALWYALHKELTRRHHDAASATTVGSSTSREDTHSLLTELPLHRALLSASRERIRSFLPPPGILVDDSPQAVAHRGLRSAALKKLSRHRQGTPGIQEAAQDAYSGASEAGVPGANLAAYLCRVFLSTTPPLVKHFSHTTRRTQFPKQLASFLRGETPGAPASATHGVSARWVSARRRSHAHASGSSRSAKLQSGVLTEGFDAFPALAVCRQLTLWVTSVRSTPSVHEATHLSGALTAPPSSGTPTPVPAPASSLTEAQSSELTPTHERTRQIQEATPGSQLASATSAPVVATAFGVAGTPTAHDLTSLPVDAAVPEVDDCEVNTRDVRSTHTHKVQQAGSLADADFSKCAIDVLAASSDIGDFVSPLANGSVDAPYSLSSSANPRRVATARTVFNMDEHIALVDQLEMIALGQTSPKTVESFVTPSNSPHISSTAAASNIVALADLGGADSLEHDSTLRSLNDSVLTHGSRGDVGVHVPAATRGQSINRNFDAGTDAASASPAGVTLPQPAGSSNSTGIQLGTAPRKLERARSARSVRFDDTVLVTHLPEPTTHESSACIMPQLHDSIQSFAISPALPANDRATTAAADDAASSSLRDVGGAGSSTSSSNGGARPAATNSAHTTGSANPNSGGSDITTAKTWSIWKAVLSPSPA